jgi:RimJ/RimL family protein N-acetyltransferase
VIVLVGGQNPYYNELEAQASLDIRIKLQRNATNMPELMAWADVAISAGGSTCWELFFMRTPSIVIPIAKNQEPVVKELQSKKIAKVIELNALKSQKEFAKIIIRFLQSFEMRSAFSKRMAQYIDGKGPFLVVNAICNNRIKIRKAELSDCKKIWLWINDPLVRSVSFNPEPISLERHMEWFSSALIDSDLVYYIALDENETPFGQVRFQIESGEAIISVLIDPEYRGISLGSLLIQYATEKFFVETGIKKVNAFIKIGNEVSRKAFTKAGYIEYGLSDYMGENAYHLIQIQGEK